MVNFSVMCFLCVYCSHAAVAELFKMLVVTFSKIYFLRRRSDINRGRFTGVCDTFHFGDNANESFYCNFLSME